LLDKFRQNGLVESNGTNWFWLCPSEIGKLAELRNHLKSKTKATTKLLVWLVKMSFTRGNLELENDKGSIKSNLFNIF
jgi:hypothetical protein